MMTKAVWAMVISVSVGILFCTGCQQEQHPSVTGDWNVFDIYRMPQTPMQTRWFTAENPNGEKGAGGKTNYGRKGYPCFNMAPGQTIVLADIAGSGTIRHIWIAGPTTSEFLRGVRLEMYWDNAKTPAVRAPAGDFFCHSLGKWAKFDNALFSSPEGRSLNSLVPMPFKSHAKIQIINESNIGHLIFYEVDATLGDVHGAEMMYFHAHWVRENPTTIRQDFTILPKIEGRGRFLGCNIGMRIDSSYPNWFGEGEVKIYLDGDTQLPTLCGTGTEDYIRTGYGQGWYSNPYYGNHYVGPPLGGDAYGGNAYGFYRFHVTDPVFFYKDIRVTMQNISWMDWGQRLRSMDVNPDIRFMVAGEDKKENLLTRQDVVEAIEKNSPLAPLTEGSHDCCATAYWYMDKPENGMGDIPSVERRMADLPEGKVWNEDFQKKTMQ